MHDYRQYPQHNHKDPCHPCSSPRREGVAGLYDTPIPLYIYCISYGVIFS